MASSFYPKDLNVAGWGWLLFGGIVALAYGFFTIYYPVAGVVSIIVVSGSAFIVGGFLNIYHTFQLKNLKNDAGKIKDAVGKIKAEFGSV